MRLIVISLLLVMLIKQGHAQHKPHDSPYRFNWKHEIAISTSTLVYLGAGAALDFTRKGLTPAQIGSLDASSVNRFDRRAINFQSDQGTLVSDILLGTSFVLPAGVLAFKRCRADALIIGLMWVEVAGITLGTTEFAKALALRNRPFVYNKSVNINDKLNRDARMSFFSGHTSAAAAFSFFGAKVFSDYSDNTTHKILVWTGAIILPGVVGYLRVRGGKHFPTDVIAGYAIGAAVGYLVPFLHKRKQIVDGMSIAPYSSGRKDIGVYIRYRL